MYGVGAAAAPPLGGNMVDRAPVLGLNAISRVELCAAGAVSFCTAPLDAGALTVCRAMFAKVSLKLVPGAANLVSSSLKAAYMTSYIMPTVLPQGLFEQN